MIWKGWNNGSHLLSGSGYGLKMTESDRDANFNVNWDSVNVHLPGPERPEVIEVTITPSFWKKCSELRNQKIGKWLIRNGYAPWPKGKPPGFTVDIIRDREFRVG